MDVPSSSSAAVLDHATRNDSCRCSCTCSAPLAVYLDHSSDNSKRLRENFQNFGWSPITLPVPTSLSDTAWTGTTWKEACRAAFVRPETVTDDSDANRECTTKQGSPIITWIGNESGSATATTVEPKRSIECTWQAANSHGSSQQHSPTKETLLIERTCIQWVRQLSSVAERVGKALALPADTLLVHHTEKLGTGKEELNNPTNQHSSCLDLLRAFCYESCNTTVDPRTNSNNTASLGSSPHTDWGSFTVIWQDDVGGLEIWCDKCQWYQPVATTKLTDPVTFVVLVGDCTSLAMQAGAGTFIEKDDCTPCSIEASSPSLIQHHQVAYWPSLKHRVVSSPDSVRHSLVYFCYPPADTTLASIASAIQKKQTWSENARSMPSGCRTPPHHYSLLQQQGRSSSQSDAAEPIGDRNQLVVQDLEAVLQAHDVTTPAIRLAHIWHQPVGQVLQDKWSQVQR